MTSLFVTYLLLILEEQFRRMYWNSLFKIQVRMLDNVIDLNMIPVPQAELTNAKYRAIGLGTFGWHHLLALNNIRWESDEAVEFADKLYERIAFLTIQASVS